MGEYAIYIYTKIVPHGFRISAEFLFGNAQYGIVRIHFRDIGGIRVEGIKDPPFPVDDEFILVVSREEGEAPFPAGGRTQHGAIGAPVIEFPDPAQ